MLVPGLGIRGCLSAASPMLVALCTSVLVYNMFQIGMNVPLKMVDVREPVQIQQELILVPDQATQIVRHVFYGKVEIANVEVGVL